MNKANLRNDQNVSILT